MTKPIIKIILSFIAIFIIAISFTIYSYYQKIYSPNVSLNGKQNAYFYIPTGSTMEDVSELLYSKNYIINRGSFEWVAEKKNYRNKIKPGKYFLTDKLSNNDLVDLLRSGKQQICKVVFNYARTKEELAGKLAENIEADSLDILSLLKNKSVAQKYGFDLNTIITMFIPNTYEFYWSTSADKIFARMAKEYKKFWNVKRKAKAKKIHLSQSEVSSLASIVESETKDVAEKPIVAGVYINRLKKGMKLEADPTVIYALGDFSIKRVLKKHLSIDSPYNTYKYAGLPPGPICLPTISSIDAVLNYKKHKYIFFCAKEDFSGRHNFAKSYFEHLRNARKYQKALRKLNRKRK